LLPNGCPALFVLVLPLTKHSTDFADHAGPDRSSNTAPSGMKAAGHIRKFRLCCFILFAMGVSSLLGVCDAKVLAPRQLHGMSVAGFMLEKCQKNA